MAGSALLLLLAAIALQASSLWRCARSQQPGFISIDCGADADYTDAYGILWTKDADLSGVGKSLPVTGGTNHILSTMRLFDGNQSKYCYSLTNSAVTDGAFFLVRASIWAGINPPYVPKNPDGYFHFTMIVDSNEWQEVDVPYGSTTWYSYEFYTRAQSSTIDVCFARSTTGGDAPFINGLELRPLPPTLTTTGLMNSTGVNFVLYSRENYGVLSNMPSVVRYNNDTYDRVWLSDKTTPDNANTTESAITSAQNDHPPASVLQTAFMGKPFLWLNYSNLNVQRAFFAEFYFAEIDPSVNASAKRVFNIKANDVILNTLGEDVDVFAEVGPNAAYAYPAVVKPDSSGSLIFNFTPTESSSYPSFLAAAEIFYAQSSTSATDSSVVEAVEALKSDLGLTSYTGDPCLPAGFGYNWLNCSGTTITTLSLSNYGTGGTISEAINNLTFLSNIHMDGNSLHGEIPNLSALSDLQVLDLSNNGLSGSVPDSLATLKNLKVLNLQNNNLSGDIPAALLQRKQASTLDFNFSGNPFCATNAALGCAPAASSVPERSPSPPEGGSDKKKSNMGVIIGAIIAGLLAVLLATGILIYCLCRNRPSSSVEQPFKMHQQEEQELAQTRASPVLDNVISESLRAFSFQEMKRATDDFANKIGTGGFGPVYKGRLQDGRWVAVKVASNSSHQGSKEFLNEIELLSRIHHKKLVGFLGYCNEGKLMLVYEFMSNGSVFDYLHGPYAKASPLPWDVRLRIVVDAAHGIDYLHHGCNPRIIHRDIKSSNILLNDNLEAKISDFGISRNTLINATGAPPTALMGSMGYMDPEYLSTMKLTEKVDVYSFGVVLFEIVCGRTAVFEEASQQIHIVEWAKPFIQRGVIDEIVDPSLHGQYDVSAVWRVLETALACVQFSGARRPTMSTVYLELREAEKIELESDRRGVFDQPSVEFTGVNDETTGVTAR